jgi:uncharacterized protein
MTWMDHALVLLFAVVLPAWGCLAYRSYKERVRAGIPGARLAAYAEGMIQEWLLVAAVTALWIHQDRDWAWIGLAAPDSSAGALALAAAGLIGALLLLQSAVVARRPETHERVRAAMRSSIEAVPVQRSDLTGFVALSLTAGVCEEILFRGVLPWYLAGYLGQWGAHGAAVVVFGAAHLFLGAGGAVRALLTGAVLAALYLWSGSLVPSIVLHALVDISSGWMAYEVLRERTVEAPAPA